MSGIFLRWGIPALLTVIGTTAAAIATAGTSISVDLARRATPELTDPALSWAKVSFDMQDAVISGTATTQAMVDEAIAKVSGVRGVRSVTSEIVLAEFVSPFPFIATVSDGRLTLTGGVPDAAARDEIRKIAGAAAVDNTRLMSGAPERAKWLAAVKFALHQALDLDEGEVAVSDLEVTLSGRAKSPAAYDDLLVLVEQAPLGVKLAFHEVQPALAAPFEWHARFDGKELELSGFVPDADVASALAGLAPDGIAVSSTLAPASGAPEEFAASARLLVQNLLQLEGGSASISDATISLDGLPADASTAERVRSALSVAGAEVKLGAPKVAQYAFSATRSNGKIVLTGFVPDDATLARLSALNGVDATALQLGRGEPDHFEAGVDFVLAAIAKMSEGQVGLAGTTLSVAGRAASVDSFAALEATLASGAPQGLVLASSALRPPVADPFTFAIERSGDGTFAFTGFVPSTAVLERMKKTAAKVGKEQVTVADGNPGDFEPLALKAIELLALLDQGRATFDGKHWSLSGAVSSLATAKTLRTAFDAAGLAGAGWSYDVSEPAVPALPVVDPYVWHAQKASDGTLTLTGFVPSPELKTAFSSLLADTLQDGTSLGAGAPETFDAAARAAVRALADLKEGAADYSAGAWTLTGTVATTTDRYRIEKELRASADISGWQLAIQAADAAPVVSPFVWAASKSATGDITLSGYVPTEALRSSVATKAGKVAADRSLVGSGEPEGFSGDVMAAVSALSSLMTGEVRYEGGIWSISGQPNTQDDASAVTAALAATSDQAAGWQLALLPPLVAPIQAVAAVPEPAMTPAAPEPVAPDVPAAPATAPDSLPQPPAEPVTADPATTPPVVPPAAEPAPQQAVPEEAASAAVVVRNYTFEVKKSADGKLSLSGKVPSEEERLGLVTANGAEPAANLTVGEGLPLDFAENAAAGTRALALLADGEFGLEGQQWVLSGRAETDAARQAALNELRLLPAGQDWQSDVSLLPPLDVCKGKVAAFVSRNTIRFETGGAKLLKESSPALDELANDLALCREATVNVEGHTDADGEAEDNLALSVARAEAVVDALILRGVAPERLYAVGYGESLPIASNETRAGKQANRRIAFSLTDQ